MATKAWSNVELDGHKTPPTGRENKRCAKLEDACLALVQKENEVLEEEEDEDSEGSSKKKKRKAVVLPKEIKTFGDEE